MKIKDMQVVVCCPGRNFVSVPIVTDAGLLGLGDVTPNGREMRHFCERMVKSGDLSNVGEFDVPVRSAPGTDVTRAERYQYEEK